MEILRILFIAALVLFAFFLAVGLIDGNRFNVVHEQFELPNLSRKCRFVMISDLHNKEYGHKNKKVIEAVDKINPDFIIIAGDLVTAKPDKNMKSGIDLVNELSKKYKIYYGIGNHESKMKQYTGKFGDKYNELKKAVKNENIYMLENDSVDIPEYNIKVSGFELELKYFAHFKMIRMEDGYMEKSINKCDRSKCNLLIAHNPDYFNEYADWGADLVLSGHVHGGIMRLPLLGGVIAPSYKIFPEYDGGVFEKGKSKMLLGRGMGAHTIPLRFFNPAELYAVELTPKD